MSRGLISLVVSQALPVLQSGELKKEKDLGQPVSQLVIFQTKELLTVLYPFYYIERRELLWHLHEKWDWW